MYQRILQNAPATVVAHFPDQDGEPRSVAGPVTVAVRRLDGSLVDTLDATEAAELRYEASLPLVATESLDTFVLSWSAEDGATKTIVDVVGGVFFTVADVRSRLQSARERTIKYPSEDIIAFRQDVETECESICNRAFVPRFGRSAIQLESPLSAHLGVIDLRRLRSVSVGSRTFTTDELSRIDFDVSGRLAFNSCPAWLSMSDWLEVEYEFGWDRPPADLKTAAIQRLRSRLTADSNTLNERAITLTGEQGTMTLFTPGLRGAHTGIPAVDEAYGRYAWASSDVFSVGVR